MDENTLKIIKDKFDSLPESIQELIMSAQYQDALSAISRKYQLSFEQTSILERETTLVLMGLSPVISFENSLKEELRFENLRISQIFIDINNQIFSNVETLLKLMYTPEGEEPELDDVEGSIISPYSNEKTLENISAIPTKPAEVTYPYMQEEVLSTKGESNSKLKGLSPEIQNAIDKSDYASALYTISQQHKLNVPQMGILEEAVTGVMVGKVHPDKFEGYLQQNLKLSTEENTNLVNEINETIFKPIRDNMMVSFDRRKETDTEKSDNDAILKKAGIELGPQAKEESINQIPKIEEREEILSKVEHPDNVQKIVFVQTDKIPQKPTITPSPTPAPGVDPYRMPIE
jgi:hypothetical protein